MLTRKNTHVGSVLTDAPAIMAQLTGEFVEAKDLNTRAKIRQRMKAVLDFVAADTAYPDVEPDGGGFGVPPAPPHRYINVNTNVRPIAGADNTI